MSSGVHGEGAGTTAESVTFGSEFASVAHAAEQLVIVLVSVGRVQHLVAQTAFEALFVPLLSTGNSLFSGVDRLLALGAFGDLSGDERHFSALDS